MYWLPHWPTKCWVFLVVPVVTGDQFDECWVFLVVPVVTGDQFDKCLVFLVVPVVSGDQFDKRSPALTSTRPGTDPVPDTSTIQAAVSHT